MAIVRRRSPYSGRFHERDIDVDVAKFDVWLEAWNEKLEGLPNIQDMFPEINAHDRKFLFSGITPEEQELRKLEVYSDPLKLIPIEAHESLQELKSYGIEQASRHVKYPGAVGFRTEDGFSSPQVYVDDVMAAARIAAPFRFHSMYVYVITAENEVVNGWESGVPFEDDPVSVALSKEAPVLEIELGDENFTGLLEYRDRLSANLETMFGIAVGPPDEQWNDYNEDFKFEAKRMYEASHNYEPTTRSLTIAAWMLSTNHSFAKMHIELMAYNMLIRQFGKHITPEDYDEKLSDLEVGWAEIEEHQSGAVRALVQKILDSHDLHPSYIDKVRSEKDASRLCRIHGEKLPLVFVWGEKPIEHGTKYSFTINGHILGHELEKTLSRQDPSFEAVRNNAMEQLRKIVGDSIAETLNVSGLKPSLVFQKFKIKKPNLRH